MIHYSLISRSVNLSSTSVADGQVVHFLGTRLTEAPLSKLSRVMKVRLSVVKKFIASAGKVDLSCPLTGAEQAVLYTLLRFIKRIERNAVAVKAGRQWERTFSYINCNSGCTFTWTHRAERVFNEII
jgi:hypothetical protein